MKIRAIRLAECGRFHEPVALEGLTGGLDVLAGPNELGKSTILKALRTALTVPSTSNSSLVQGLRPYRGGAPSIEVDFDLGGKRYRISKRYLAQRQAMLHELDGNKIARGAAAEAELVRLLGESDRKGSFSLLWVDQGDALKPIEITAEARSGLDATIAAEVASIAGGTRARVVREMVREALDALVTSKQQKPRKAYEAAIELETAKSEQLAQKRALHQQAELQLQRLAALRTRERELSDPKASAARTAMLEKAQKACDDGTAARQRVGEAQLERNAREAASALAARELATFDTELAQLAEIDRQDAQSAARLAELTAARDALAPALASAQAETAALQAAVKAAEEERRAAQDFERREIARARQTELQARYDGARNATARIAELLAELEKLHATADQQRAARSEADAMQAIEARLSAAAPTVKIAYLPGAASRIRTGDRALGDGETVVAETVLVLDVEGIGSVTIEPGRGEEATSQRAALERHRTRLSDILSKAGVPDLAAFEHAVLRRRDLEIELDAARSALKAAAPDGIQRLEASLQGARAAAEDKRASLAAPRRSLTEIEAAIEAEDGRLKETAATLARLVATDSAYRSEAAELAAVARARIAQRQGLEARLPPPVDRARHRSELSAAKTTADAELHVAVLAHEAWKKEAPDAPALARLQEAAAAAVRAVQSADRELQGIAADAARIEGELQSLANEDVAAAVEFLTDEVEQARAEVRRFRLEVAALQMLEAELAAESSAAEDAYLAPVKARLEPYLGRLFPDAGIGFDGQLRISTLARGGVEDFARLSDGTREQIAVLTRLAFARLLAEGGRDVPVILDDALVFSDDDRIATLFGLLGEAASHHQVIVLTCRTQGFRALGGTRVSLTPWARAAA